MVPSWIPAHLLWAYFVGCALFAAATSLTVRKFVCLSSTLLGLMLFLFVCMMPIPNALADPKNRFAWAYALRDLSFAGGAWALAGLHSRASSPQQSKWMILLGGGIVIAIAAIFLPWIFSSSRVCARFSFGKDHAIVGSIPQRMGIPHRSDSTGRWNRLGPDQNISDGCNLDWRTNDRPHSIPISAYLDPRHCGTTPAIMEAINYVFDTRLYVGTALVLAWALPRDPDHVEKT
jgi:hypothetical protein